MVCCSRHVAFSLVTVSAAIAVFSVLSKSHRRKIRKPPLQPCIKKNPSFHQFSADNKDMISQLPDEGSALNEDIIISQLPDEGGSALDKDIICDKDNISQLPDDILISIIARMPVNSGVRTTVLSKRWRNLHRYVSDVTLDCDYLIGHRRYENPKLIMDYVNGFLRLRSGTKIRSFHLSCSFHALATDEFKECAYSLRRMGVQKLVVRCDNSSTNSKNPFPFQLSEIPSLKYLKLSSSQYSPVPSWKSQCKSLQVIWLYRAKLDSGDMANILSNCSILNSLRISYCDCPDKMSFCGPGLKLSSLYMDNCKNVKEMEFDAINLSYVELLNLQPVTFIFDHVPGLDSIYITANEKNIVPYVGKISKDLPHLKSLTVAIEGDYFQGSIRSVEISMFNNLRRLGLTLRKRLQIDLFSLVLFLQSCPLLQEFHLNTNFARPNEAQEKRPPIVFHRELKKVKISGFRGSKNEIELASYILKSATSLEKMCISRCIKMYLGCATWSINEWRRHNETRWNEEASRMIHKQLQGKAISETAQIIVQYAAPIEDDDNWGRVGDDYSVFH